MDIRTIDEDISVAPQISVADVEEIARLGFRTLVANRPDQEDPGQPAMKDIEAAAEAHGLKWVFLPVASGNITENDVDCFAPMFEETPKPVLAFCRSGTRCTVLWALSNARKEPVAPLLMKAQRAGYDLSGIKPRLEQQARHHARND